MLAFFPAGALLTAAHQAQPAAAPTLLNYAGGDEVTLTGYVARSGSLRRGRDLHESLDFAVEEAQWDGESAQAGDRHRAPQSLRAGHELGGRAKRTTWRRAVAPPVFDYRAAAADPGQAASADKLPESGEHGLRGLAARAGRRGAGLGEIDKYRCAAGAGRQPVERIRWRARRSVLERMARLWTAPYAGLFQAMVLGERGLVSRDERLEFQRSGTFHLLVVSGMNVAVFAVFLLWLMRWLRLPQEYAVWRQWC